MPLTQQQALALHQAIDAVNFEEATAQAKEQWANLMKPSQKPIAAQPSGNPENKKELHALHVNKLKELQEILIKVRKANLDRKSVKIRFDEHSVFGKKTIRVFDPLRQGNFNSDIPDIFARGVDSANAVLEILQHAPMNLRGSQASILSQLKKEQEHPNQSALNEFLQLMTDFKENMRLHEDQSNMKAAMKEFKRFNAALSALLVEYQVVEEHSQAEKAINLVRDFVWKRDLCSAHCSIERQAKGSAYKMLRYAEPMTFGPSEFRLSTPDSSRLDFWKTDKAWLGDLASELGLSHQTMAGSWFNSFIEANQEKLASLSSTPMSRFTPNPANAFDCTDFLVDILGNRIVQMGHHVRMAITDPLDVQDPEERQKLTDFNHLQLLSKNRLASEITCFMDNWGALFNKDEPIPLTLLHQTLIGDEVTFSPDQIKAVRGFDGSVINAKQEANDAVRTMIKNSIILRQKTAPHAIIFLKKSLAIEEQDGVKLYEDKASGGKLKQHYLYAEYQPVNISLLETNNCVNMWHPRARIRNNDVNDARQLINHAVELFEQCNAALDRKDLATLIAFLKSRDHSVFTPYKYRGAAVKAAIASFSKYLSSETSLPELLKTLNKGNLNLSLQAAVQLKCTVHETWFGSMHRTVSNLTRDIRDAVPVLGHLVDWTARTVLWILSTALSILAFPLNVRSYIKHIADRKEIAKANYEGLLAESIGSLMGGCMSAADRAGEIDEQRAALRRQFADEGVLLGYNDSPKKKLAFFETYGSTRTKHDSVEMATGTAVTNDVETRGFSPALFVAKCLAAIKLISPETVNLMTVGLMSSRVETQKERNTNAEMSGLRKGGFDTKIRSSTMYTNAVDNTVSSPATSNKPTPQLPRVRAATNTGHQVPDNRSPAHTM